jgi:hypothetical protein
MYKIDICRQHDKINFLDWIYQDSNIYLDRKYKKYLKVKKELRSYAEPRRLEIDGKK